MQYKDFFRKYIIVVILFFICYILFSCNQDAYFIDKIKLDNEVVAEAKFTITPVGGTFTSDITVDLTCDNGNSIIYYTIDDTTPDNISSIRYDSPFEINRNTTL